MIDRCFRKLFKKEYSLDSDIPLSYLLGSGLEMLCSILRGFFRAFRLHCSPRWFYCGRRVTLRCKSKMQFGKTFRLGNDCTLDALSQDGIAIGNWCSLGKRSSILCSGSMKKLGKGISIGHNSHFGEDCFFGAAGGITIGSDVIGGQQIRFHAENHNFRAKDLLIHKQGVSHQGICVGDNCWIGAGATFLDGATVGSGCVIGANTLVRGDVPPDSIVVGNLGKVVSKRF